MEKALSVKATNNQRSEQGSTTSLCRQN